MKTITDKVLENGDIERTIVEVIPAKVYQKIQARLQAQKDAIDSDLVKMSQKVAESQSKLGE